MTPASVRSSSRQFSQNAIDARQAINLMQAAERVLLRSAGLESAVGYLILQNAMAYLETGQRETLPVSWIVWFV